MSADLDDARREWERDSELAGPRFDAVADPPPRLIAFGAVPLSAELVRAGAALGWRPSVVDPRSRFATDDGFPGAAEVVCAWPAEAFARLGAPDARTAVLALTHAPELDDPALAIALASEAFYVGAMGSRRTQSRRRERLAAAGVAPEALSRPAGPAGLDLGGRSIHEAALAILAEAVAALHGRAGGRLTDSEASIHAGERP